MNFAIRVGKNQDKIAGYSIIQATNRHNDFAILFLLISWMFDD